MALEKLHIYPEPDPKNPRRKNDFEVMFNPTTYSISKAVTWQPAGGRNKYGNANDAQTNAPSTSFGGGGSRTLALELFYDVTEANDSDADVRDETDRIVELTRIRRDANNPRPPVCRIEWGGESQ